MSKSIIALVIIVLAGVIVFFASAFIVKETEQVVVVQFGEVVRLVDEPGLNFKVPFIQKAKKFEKRWLEWDGDANQITTLDKRYIYIDVFARWRISDPLVFIETLSDEVSAQGRLDDIIDNATRNVVANHKLIEAIRSTNRQLVYTGDEAHYSVKAIDDEMAADERAENLDRTEAKAEAEAEAAQEAAPGGETSEAAEETEAGEKAEPAVQEEADQEENQAAEAKDVPPTPIEEDKANSEALTARTVVKRRNPYAIEFGREKLTRLVLEKASAKAAQLGIEIRDVQIKRINYIESVQAKVFDRMISERKRVAEAYRSEGRGRSAEIIGKMEMELQQIQSEAYRESQKIMGRADAKAAKIYAEAYQKNPEFYNFTKTMESYRRTIDEESWLILSTDADYARHLGSQRGRYAD
jgi:membrane protease subunit HflC